ncbi:hypothetical protein [Carboxylicivirga caseinilyticus]|uniref:hypothetical protein n=1 Tax=Carboxylicivirga caseinilyticus TaxID=3417572 RepID=UPI003D33B6DA|nr:hypothetical protein [Marinilabiliaceae bacterium A049]
MPNYYQMPNGYLPQGFNQGYNGQSYVARGFRPQYHSRPRKKSGCKYNPNAKNGAPVITGWNKSRSRGFISFIASPHKKKSKGKNPNYETWMVKVTSGIQTVWHVGQYNLTKGILTIPDLNMVANPKAPNGGFFGSFLKRR